MYKMETLTECTVRLPILLAGPETFENLLFGVILIHRVDATSEQTRWSLMMWRLYSLQRALHHLLSPA